MKMKITWLCAIGVTCGGMAHAQSSVDIFGIVDMGVRRANAAGVGSTTAASSSGISPSLLGFRGVEDLGGGLKSGFWLEGSLIPTSGSGRPTNTNNQASGVTTGGGFAFDRRSYVSLSNGLGELRLGRDFTPTHYANIYYDPFMGLGVARAGNLTFSDVGNGPLYTTVDTSNSVSYWLPSNLGGLYGMAMVGLGENVSTSSNSQDGNLAGARVGYASGRFDLAAAMTRTRYAATTTLGNFTQSNFGISWDAGSAKFFAMYNIVQVGLSGGDVRKDTMEIGVRVPVGQLGEIRASYAQLDDRSDAALRNADGSVRSNNGATQLGLGYVYTLSKRTALYAQYARLNNHGRANYAVSGGVVPLPGGASTGVEFGIRHRF